MKKRLAIITTHPIQYNAPLFERLHKRGNLQLKVFYTWGQALNEVYDKKFGLNRSWDIPLLSGYDNVFVKNISKRPDSNRFFGIINPGLLKQIKNEKYDAVLIIKWSVWSHFCLLQCIGSYSKLFFRGDSTMLNKKTWLTYHLKKIFLRFVYRKVTKSFVVGKYNKTYMQQCGLNESQLILAPHAIDNERFAAHAVSMEQRARLERQKLDIYDNYVVFHYAGKFYEEKQLDLLISAFQQLDNSQCRLLFTGSGEGQAKLKELASKDSRIIFQSFKNQSEMPWVYRMGDVFVLPSKNETWGLSVNESMACGRPAIVSSRCGCAPEMSISGKTGYTFDTMNDLLNCLKLLQYRSSILAMQPFVEAHIKNFNLDRVCEAIENALVE